MYSPCTHIYKSLGAHPCIFLHPINTFRDTYLFQEINIVQYCSVDEDIFFLYFFFYTMYTHTSLLIDVCVCSLLHVGCHSIKSSNLKFVSHMSQFVSHMLQPIACGVPFNQILQSQSGSQRQGAVVLQLPCATASSKFQTEDFFCPVLNICKTIVFR